MKKLIIFALLCYTSIVSAQEDLKKNDVKIFMSLLYNTADELRFNLIQANISGDQYSGSMVNKMDKALGIGIGLENLEHNKIGIIGSLNIELDRKINSQTVKIGSETETTVLREDEKPRLAIATLDLNAAYSFNNFYFPIGFNIPNVQFSRSKDSEGSFNITGDIGYQTGIGFKTENDLAFEVLLKSISVKATGLSSDSSVDYGKGYIEGINLNLKIYFK